jgi:hypothetical protein
VDLTVYGGSSAGCCSLPIMHKGDGALEVVLPCLNVPMEWSSFKSFSTLKTSALVMIRDLCGWSVCLPTICWREYPTC